ncbi:MAG: hypothetical protein OXI33_12615 [Chloroflexota bacterium]|nr:hypothetical protein [Chloroflexota bacterium]
MHKRRYIYWFLALTSPRWVWNPSVKSFSFKYVIGHAELIRQSGGNLPQSSSCVKVQKAASVEK